MEKILQKYDTKSFNNTAGLIPSYVDRSANMKLLQKLEARNKVRQSQNTYKYKNMIDGLKQRQTFTKIEKPDVFARNAPEREAMLQNVKQLKKQNLFEWQKLQQVKPEIL